MSLYSYTMACLKWCYLTTQLTLLLIWLQVVILTDPLGSVVEQSSTSRASSENLEGASVIEVDNDPPGKLRENKN